MITGEVPGTHRRSRCPKWRTKWHSLRLSWSGKCWENVENLWKNAGSLDDFGGLPCLITGYVPFVDQLVASARMWMNLEDFLMVTDD